MPCLRTFEKQTAELARPATEAVADFHVRALRAALYKPDAELAIYYQAATTEPKERHLRKRRAEATKRAAQLEGLLEPAARILDFGCGSGELVRAMLEKGHDSHSFEPGDTYGSYAKSGYGERITVAGWQAGRLAGWQAVMFGAPFDLVTCSHVVEHLRDPVAAMQQMAEWTVPGGLVYVEVPDLGSNDPNNGFGALHFAHLTGFNRHNLVVATARAGLKPERIIDPTGIIFRRAEMVADTVENEARQGRELSDRLYGGGRIVSSYLRYQAGKLGGSRWSRR
jgi:2-polyprenyl-3-methyl-5-hydroxy-6-metoxy-1,4-benzoquinol methylase